MPKGKRISDYIPTTSLADTVKLDDSLIGKDLQVINWEFIEGRFGEVVVIYTKDNRSVRTSSEVVIKKFKQLNKDEIDFPLIVQFIKVESASGRTYYDVV